MVVDERLQALLEQGEELGCLNLSAVSEFLQEADLDDDQTTGFFEQLEEKGNQAKMEEAVKGWLQTTLGQLEKE